MGLGAHFGQVFCTPGLTSPVQATGSFARRRTAVPPAPLLKGTTKSSASGSSYIDAAPPVRLKAMSESSGENAGKYSLYAGSDAPARDVAAPPAPPGPALVV